ncbi:MAG: FliH/SctL family protein [Aeromonadaceae bacterium]
MKKELRLIVPQGAVRHYHFPPLQRLQAGQEALQDLQQFEQGFEQGVGEGFAVGQEQGIEQGKRLGFEQGLQQGMQQGLADGERQGRALFEKALSPFERLREELESLSRQRLGEQHALLVELVTQVARRVIHAELTLNPQQILQLVQDALSTLPEGEEGVRLFINPDDRQRLQALGYSSCGGWPLEADAALGVGDCRIESRQSVVESQTESRLVECLTQVASVLGSEGEA